MNGSLRMKEKTIKQNKHFGNFFARPSGSTRCPSSENSESNRIWVAFRRYKKEKWNSRRQSLTTYPENIFCEAKIFVYEDSQPNISVGKPECVLVEDGSTQVPLQSTVPGGNWTLVEVFDQLRKKAGDCRWITSHKSWIKTRIKVVVFSLWPQIWFIFVQTVLGFCFGM